MSEKQQALMNLDDAPKQVTIAEAVTQSQIAVLTQKTPKKAIKVRPGKGGKHFSYVEHAWVTATLNAAFNWGWSWDVLEWHTVPENDPSPFEVFILGRLTIHSPRGDIVKTQFGTASVKRDRNQNILSVGDDLKAASSDGLKKAASLLGVALDLYSSDLDDVYESGGDNGRQSVTEDLAKATGAQVTSNEPFASKEDAIRWGFDQGVFGHINEARNSYTKLYRETNPKPDTPGDMHKLWREKVYGKIGEPPDDE